MNNKPPQIILFLVDGWGSYYLNEKDTPFWYQHTVRSLRNVAPTITGPNWASILSGKTPRKHHILKNEQLSYYRQSKRYPLKTLCDDFPHSVMISDWKRMSLFTSEVFYHTRRVLEDFPQIYQRHKDAPLFILNIDRLDSVAHAQGWGSEAFYRVARRVDRLTEGIYQFLLTQNQSFVLLGLADHGGYEKDHDLETCAAIRRVPLLCVQHSVRSQPFKWWPTPRIRSTTGFRPWLLSHVRSFN